MNDPKGKTAPAYADEQTCAAVARLHAWAKRVREISILLRGSRVHEEDPEIVWQHQVAVEAVERFGEFLGDVVMIANDGIAERYAAAVSRALDYQRERDRVLGKREPR